jgi:NADPH2:quinone reductase
MQAWMCESLDGVDALKWRDLPTPEPQAGEVRVAIHAASLNFPDSLTIVGKYQFKPELPFVPGSEFSGRIDALGEGVTGLKVGDPVIGIASSGGFATHACLPAARVLPLPPGVDLDRRRGLRLHLRHLAPRAARPRQLQAGETVLVLGAAGGVGTAAVQIAKAAGARVIAAASSDAKCAFLKTLGADETINYSECRPARRAQVR